MIRIIIIGVLVLAPTQVATSQDESEMAARLLLLVDGRVPNRMIVTTVDVATIPESLPSELSVGDGILAVLKPATCAQWRRALNSEEQTKDWSASSLPNLLVHLVRDDHRKRLSLIEADEHSYVLTDGEQFARMPKDVVELSLQDAPMFRGSRELVTLPRGESVSLPHPYVASPIELTAGRMNQRIYRGMNVEVRSADRTLGRETMHVRLPRNYDPSETAGLMVWASPTRNGEIPRVLFPSLDELNMVAIGVDNSGNARDVPEKFQLMFDAVATAQRRFNIDPERLFIAGMSGGGKVASVLTLCFPEVFRGAMCMAGVGTPHELDDSWQQHRFAYCRPNPASLALAKNMPFALVVGPLDFNFAEMKLRHDLLVRDAFDRTRFFEYRELGHHMPTAEQCLDALRFINDAARQFGHESAR